MRLEPDEGKLSRPVLRGPGWSDPTRLPDHLQTMSVVKPMLITRKRIIAVGIAVVCLSNLAEAQARRNRKPDPCLDHPHVIRLSPKVLKDRATHQVDPQLPKKCRCEGRAIVQVLVDEDGKVMCARYKHGHPLLRKVALEAAKQWRFRTFELSGVPVKYYGDLELDISEQLVKKPGV